MNAMSVVVNAKIYYQPSDRDGYGEKEKERIVQCVVDQF